MKKMFLLLSIANVFWGFPVIVAADPQVAVEDPAHATKLITDNSQKMQSSSTGWSIVKRLTEGNQRFVSGKGSHPHQSPGRRGELSTGQSPHTIVLSCSDSRVPPEVVFDQGLGDLFTVRTAGHVAEPGAIASIEYAVEHLGAKVLLVMGHTSCGAVKATLSTPAGETGHSANLDALVGMIRPHVERFAEAPLSKDLAAPVRANVDGVTKSLTARSEIIRKAVDKGDLLLVHGLYHLDSGEVEIWS